MKTRPTRLRITRYYCEDAAAVAAAVGHALETLPAAGQDARGGEPTPQPDTRQETPR